MSSPVILTLQHNCPDGTLTTWSPLDPNAVDITCPHCKASFVFTSAGWEQLDEHPAEDGDPDVP